MWETTNIRPQSGDKIIAIKGSKMVIGVCLIEPSQVVPPTTMFDPINATIALIIQDDESETPLDDFYLWTLYPEGGSRDPA